MAWMAARIVVFLGLSCRKQRESKMADNVIRV